MAKQSTKYPNLPTSDKRNKLDDEGRFLHIKPVAPGKTKSSNSLAISGAEKKWMSSDPKEASYVYNVALRIAAAEKVYRKYVKANIGKIKSGLKEVGGIKTKEDAMEFLEENLLTADNTIEGGEMADVYEEELAKYKDNKKESEGTVAVKREKGETVDEYQARLEEDVGVSIFEEPLKDDEGKEIPSELKLIIQYCKSKVKAKGKGGKSKQLNVEYSGLDKYSKRKAGGKKSRGKKGRAFNVEKRGSGKYKVNQKRKTSPRPSDDEDETDTDEE